MRTAAPTEFAIYVPSYKFGHFLQTWDILKIFVPHPPLRGFLSLAYDKKWHGFGKIVPEFIIDRQPFPAKLFHRF